LPLLKAGAASSPDGKARVLHTSSMASERARIDFATFRDGPKRLKAGAYPLYPQSKLGNILVSNAMARKYGSDNIISVAINPGTLKTELTRHTNGMVAIIIVSLGKVSHSDLADPFIHLSHSQ
jgi:retinol dehydrogenase-12